MIQLTCCHQRVSSADLTLLTLPTYILRFRLSGIMRVQLEVHLQKGRAFTGEDPCLIKNSCQKKRLTAAKL